MTAVALMAILGSTYASEPTAQEKDWDVMVAALVDVISNQGDVHTLSSVIAPNAFIAPFDMNRTESFFVLNDRLPGSNIVSAHAYMHPSVSCASDIISDLTANGTIDAESMRKLVPQNDGDIRKADATMARWFESVMEAKSGDPIAVLVLYDDGKGEPIRSPQLSFILVRGEVTPTGQPRFARLLYGSIQSAAR
jgi:hypothetical protein